LPFGNSPRNFVPRSVRRPIGPALFVWKISQGGFEPSISAMWMISSRYPKDRQFGNGPYLLDGLYVVGKFKTKTEMEAKYIDVVIIRDFAEKN
jgi:hypothetical protein